MATELKVVVRQYSSSASQATIGAHQVLIDRPVSKGGSDLGPMGGELFLSAIGGCLMSNLLAAVKARDTKLSDVSAEVKGTIVDSPPRFVAIDICVTAENCDMELLAHLVKIADRGCIMMNTLRDKLQLVVSIGAQLEDDSAFLP